MGISPDLFLKRLGYSCIRVKNGISSAAIASGIQDSEGTKKVLECGGKLNMVLTGSEEGKELMSVALLSFTDPHEDEKRSVPVPWSYENNRFVNICRQMIYSLDSGISETEADSALKSMGVYGNMLDGAQRSSLVKGYRCMLKLLFHSGNFSIFNFDCAQGIVAFFIQSGLQVSKSPRFSSK